MAKRIIILYILIFSYFNISLLIADDNYSDIYTDLYSNYGIILNYNLMFNSADFSSLPSVPNCCPKFKNTNAYGFLFAGTYDYILYNYGISASVGLDYSKGNFISEEKKVISINSTPAVAILNHNLEFSLSSIFSEIGFRYYFNRLSVLFGFGANYNISSHYYQSESIFSTAGNVTFLDSAGNNSGKSVRNELSGDIPELNKLRFHSRIGLSYDLYANKDKSIIIREELSAGLYFGNMINDIHWKSSIIRFGISILFSNKDYSEEDYEASKVTNNKDDYELIKNELELLKQKARQDSTRQIEIENNLRKELALKEEKIKKIREQDSLLALQENLKNEMEEKLKQEKENFNKMIEEENKLTGKKCKCFVILYISTDDKTSAESILTKLQNSGIDNVKISIFNEPYLKTKYYRVQSDCFDNHLTAFDEKNKNYNLFGELGILPQIICNR